MKSIVGMVGRVVSNLERKYVEALGKEMAYFEMIDEDSKKKYTIYCEDIIADGLASTGIDIGENLAYICYVEYEVVLSEEAEIYVAKWLRMNNLMKYIFVNKKGKAIVTNSEDLPF